MALPTAAALGLVIMIGRNDRLVVERVGTESRTFHARSSSSRRLRFGETFDLKVWSQRMPASTLWEVKSDGSPKIRCELHLLPDGRYRLCVVRGRRRDVFVQQDHIEHATAIQLSTVVYQSLKDRGFHDAPGSEDASTSTR